MDDNGVRWASYGFSGSKFVNNTTVFNAVSNKYIADTPGNVYNGRTINTFSNEDGNKLTVYNGSTEEMPSGYVVYELATPQILDVTEYFTDENYRFIEVEGGGTITFKQDGDYKLEIPSTVEYDVKVGE